MFNMQTCRFNDFKSIDLGRQHCIYRIGTREKKEPLNSSLKNPLDIRLLEIRTEKIFELNSYYIFILCVQK